MAVVRLRWVSRGYHLYHVTSKHSTLLYPQHHPPNLTRTCTVVGFSRPCLLIDVKQSAELGGEVITGWILMIYQSDIGWIPQLTMIYCEIVVMPYKAARIAEHPSLGIISAACKDYKRMKGPWLFDAVPCCPYGIPSQFLTQSETMGSQLPFSCARPKIAFYDFHGQLLGLTPRAPLHPINPWYYEFVGKTLIKYDKII